MDIISKTKMDSNGIIFSFDALIAFIIMLFLLMGFFVFIENKVIFLEEKTNNFYLEEKTIEMADSLVKNYSVKNSLLGSAITDLEKKRVKSNNLSSALILGSKPFELENFFVKSIAFETNTRKEKKALSKKEGECIVVKRFVLIDNEKGIVFLEGCNA